MMQLVQRIEALQAEIAERKQAEAKLQKLSVAVEQSPATVVLTNIDGTIEYVNPRFVETTGYTREEAIGQNPRVLKSGKWPKNAYKKLWDTLLAGSVWRGEFHNKRKNGQLYWESASLKRRLPSCFSRSNRRTVPPPASSAGPVWD
jgi:PAS domain S-box-containing protein